MAGREPAGDIRQVRPALFTQTHLRGLVRRLVSISTLVVIDLCGLAVGLYVALILRAVYYGERPILWGLPWKAEADWLPFLALVTVLVFWRAGLYAPREQRAGAGRIVSSLLLVTLLSFFFAIGTGYQHTTYGLYPTALVLCAIAIGILRGSYEVITRDVWKLAGVRRRAVLVGEGERLLDLRRTLGLGRGGIAYEFVGAISGAGDGVWVSVVMAGRIAGARYRRNWSCRR